MKLTIRTCGFYSAATLIDGARFFEDHARGAVIQGLVQSFMIIEFEVVEAATVAQRVTYALRSLRVSSVKRVIRRRLVERDYERG